MKTKKAFSLAEALITLLIVCVIAIVSAPVITTKAKKHTTKDIWKINRERIQTVSPVLGRDIKLGQVDESHNSSIIVSGRLEFKNTKGETIGWIDEDGSSSFSAASTASEVTVVPQISQRDLQNIIKTITQQIEAVSASEKHNAQVKSDANLFSNITTNNNQNQQPSQPFSQEQMQNMESLMKELGPLLEQLNK